MTTTATSRPQAFTYMNVRWCQAVIGLLVGFEMIMGICFAFLHLLIGLGINFQMKLIVDKIETLKSNFSDNPRVMNLLNDPQLANDADLTNFNITFAIMTVGVFVEIFVAFVTIIKLFQKKRIPYTFLILLLINPIPWEFMGLTTIVQSKGSTTDSHLLYMILLAKFITVVSVYIFNGRVAFNSKMYARKIQEKILLVGQEMSNLKLNSKNTYKGNPNVSDEKKLLALSV